MNPSLWTERPFNQQMAAGMTALSLLAFVGAWLWMGSLGFILSLALLCSLLIAPLLSERQRFFLVLWHVGFPVLASLTNGTGEEGLNLATLACTGLSLPVAVYTFMKYGANSLRRLPFLAPMLLFLLWQAAFALRPGHDAGEAVMVARASFIGVFLVVAADVLLSRREADENRGFLRVLLTLFPNLSAGLAILQVLFHFPHAFMTLENGVRRLVGPFWTHPNQFGFFSGVFLCYALYGYLTAVSKRERGYWLVSMVINAVVLGMTFSKTAILCTVLAYGVFWCFLPGRMRWKILGAVLGLGLLGIGVDFAVGSPVLQGLQARFANSQTLDTRWAISQRTLAHMTPLTLLFGGGPNATTHILRALGSLDEHNSYLRLLFNYGITGLLLFLAPLFVVFSKAWGTILQGGAALRRREPQRFLACVAVVALCLFVIVSLGVDTGYLARATQYYLWGVFTLLFWEGMGLRATLTGAEAKQHGFQPERSVGA